MQNNSGCSAPPDMRRGQDSGDMRVFKAINESFE